MTEERLPLNELLQKAGDGDFCVLWPERPAIADGGRRRGADRRWPARTGRRSTELAQRLPRPPARHAAWLAQSQDPEAAGRQRLPAVPGGAQDDGKGVGRRHPGGLDLEVSTRRVDEIAQAMGLSGISKSQVSKLCKEIDERVKAFLERPLEGVGLLWLM